MKFQHTPYAFHTYPRELTILCHIVLNQSNKH